MGHWGQENRDKYTTTWTIPDGNIRRQIDYIMINNMRRNMTKAQINIYWHANMNQNQQHRSQTMQIYNAAKKYKHPIPAETGARLKYDIKELRLRPEKLTKSYHAQEEKETKTLQEARHGWGGMGEISRKH